MSKHPVNCTAIFLIVLLSLSAFGQEILFRDCLKARIDLGSLGQLNHQAYEMFPYSLSQTSDPQVDVVTSDQIVEKYLEFRQTTTKEEVKKNYENFKKSIRLFLLSGGIMIQSVDEKVSQNKNYSRCGTFEEFFSRQRQDLSPFFGQLDPISPLLIQTVALIMIESAQSHQESVSGENINKFYYFIFGAHNFSNKKNSERDEFHQLIGCTLDYTNESIQLDQKSECDEFMSSENFMAYRIFLSSAILNYFFTLDYIKNQPFEISYGLFDKFIENSVKATEKLKTNMMLGGPAYKILMASLAILDSSYRKLQKSKQ